MFRAAIRGINHGLRFLHPPLPAPPTAHLTMDLPRGQGYGLTEFIQRNTSNVDAVFSPLVEGCRLVNVKHQNQPDTFWLKPVSDFGSVPITTFINGSHTFILLPSLAPQPHRHSQPLTHPRGPRHLRGEGTLSGSFAQNSYPSCTIPRLPQGTLRVSLPVSR